MLQHKPRLLSPRRAEGRFRGESETSFPDKSGWRGDVARKSRGSRGAVAEKLYKESDISNATELGKSGPFLGSKIYSQSGAAMPGGPHSCPLRE